MATYEVDKIGKTLTVKKNDVTVHFEYDDYGIERQRNNAEVKFIEFLQNGSGIVASIRHSLDGGYKLQLDSTLTSGLMEVEIGIPYREGEEILSKLVRGGR